jgi:hypothetical protein
VPDPLARRARLALGGWIAEWWPYAFNALGPVGLGLAGAAADTSGMVQVPILGWGVRHDALAWVSAALFLVGLSAVVRRGQTLGRVKERLVIVEDRANKAEAALQALAEMELDALCKRLGYYSSERISIFIPVHDGFRLKVRFSLSPTYRTRGRLLYPLAEGCLGYAWTAGSAFSLNLPDPRQSLDLWFECLEREWGVPRATAEHLRMRSRTYAAIRIDSDARPREPLGVVVIESELIPDATSAKLHRQDIEKAIKGDAGERIRALLTQLTRAGDQG